MDIIHIVENLIKTNKEGTYWDFKLKWHDGGELLQDIISLSNNFDNREAYLIFGVSDDFNVVGLESNDNANRKNKASLTQLINSTPFADGNRPTIDLHNISIRDHEIDVIRIMSSNKVPFYLNEDFKGLRSGVIYARRNDVNTGKGDASPSDIIDKLYRIRFGIEQTTLERMKVLLDEFNNWGCFKKGIINDWKKGGDWGNCGYIFHEKFPEFRIQINSEEQALCKEPLMCFYIGNHFVQYNAIIMYHSTILYEFSIIALEEYRQYIPMPKIKYFQNERASNDQGHDNLVRFYYIIADSIEGKILKIMTNGSCNTSARQSSKNENRWLLLFKNDDELKAFIQFANINPHIYDQSIENVCSKIEQERGLSLWPSKDILQARHFYDEWKKTNDYE